MSLGKKKTTDYMRQPGAILLYVCQAQSRPFAGFLSIPLYLPRDALTTIHAPPPPKRCPSQRGLSAHASNHCSTVPGSVEEG